MSSLPQGEFAGVHAPTGGAGERLRAAFANATVVDSGPIALACAVPASVQGVHAAIAGRVQQSARLRDDLAVRSEAPIEELVAIAYARWGSGMLHRLRGPFCLAVWDDDHRRGLLAQDQLGGRSLFTYLDGSRLFFATEVSVLLALLRRRPDPDDIALAHYLVDHSVPDGRTLFRGIRRLGGGRHLLLSETSRVSGRHWAPRYEPPLDESGAELAARLRRALTSAVADAADSDRPSALLLSGGLDSSTVAAVAAPHAPALHAVSAVFPEEPDLDESAWARQVAAYTGLPLTMVPIERREPFRAAEAYLRAWQLPLPVPGLIIEEPLIAAARNLGADVVLDGQGGDELFGVASFLVADRLRAARPLSAWRLARRHPWLGTRPPLRHVWFVFANVGLRGALAPRPHERVRRKRDPARYAPPWLSAELARLYRDTHDPWRWKRLDGPRWWAWLADTLTRGRETADIADYLRRRGRMGGVQARSPLLDLGLVELALRIPPETNFDPVVSRPLVREALRSALPSDVLARTDKRDFSALHHRTLQTAENLQWVRRLLDRRTAAVGSYVDLDRMHRDHLQHPPGVGDPGWRVWAVHVWNVATAEMWLRSYAP